MKSFFAAFLAICLFTGFVKRQTYTRINIEKQTIFLSDTLKRDLETGLYEDKNLYMVKAQCTNCHSTKLIQQHRFTRDGWKQKIRWMQAKHNLWDLGETEVQVLDYLEKYYAPSQTLARRAPLKDIKWYKLNP